MVIPANIAVGVATIGYGRHIYIRAGFNARENLPEIKMILELMKFDPRTAEEKPYPSQADQFRKWHGKDAWLFNPWTNKKRHYSDIGSDPFGYLMLGDKND